MMEAKAQEEKGLNQIVSERVARRLRFLLFRLFC